MRNFHTAAAKPQEICSVRLSRLHINQLERFITSEVGKILSRSRSCEGRIPKPELGKKIRYFILFEFPDSVH